MASAITHVAGEDDEHTPTDIVDVEEQLNPVVSSSAAVASFPRSVGASPASAFLKFLVVWRNDRTFMHHLPAKRKWQSLYCGGKAIPSRFT
eukprot:1419242-Amphidinium_carterae.1